MRCSSPSRAAVVFIRVVWFAMAATLVSAVATAPRERAADTLPEQLSDSAFWKLIEDWSEPGGTFQSENFVSNESGFQVVIPRLTESTSPGGVYLGVGPEQNFTYIAAIRPKISFIIDIRRQNMLEHLLYKALFEMSANRVEFLSRLFSRQRPAGLGEKATADELFAAYRVMPTDDEAYARNLQQVKDVLLKRHAFQLTSEDEQGLEHVYDVFRDFGADLNYNSGRRGRGMPTYADLMTATDRQGEKRSYLATEENYRTVRDLEMHNAIVPLTGDFGGKKTLRAVGEYLTRHSSTVTAFYLSNVERYLFWNGPNQNGGWESFYENVTALPLDASSTFIRSVSGARGGAFGMRLPNVLASIQETLAAVKDHRIQTYDDVFTLSR